MGEWDGQQRHDDRRGKVPCQMARRRGRGYNSPLMGNAYAVVMAGGSGTRFWPLSRAARPKQLLPLLSDRPLIRETVERLLPLFDLERVFVVTAREHADALARSLSILPRENIIDEPVGRDTAACVGLAATLLRWRDPEAVFCTLPADHFVGDIAVFQSALARGLEEARRGKLVTYGVPPTRPETGYGYLEVEAGRVRRFCEKPEVGRAREFLEKGNYFWNCGIFVWRADRILAEIRRHLPDLSAALGRIEGALGTSRLPAVLVQEYAKLPRISIDFGVMEKAEEVVMVEADFGWDDVGNWVAAASHRPSDGAGNVAEGTAVTVESERNIVRTEGGHLVATLGVRDFVIIHTPDATLVCPKDRAADLKKLTEEIRAKGLSRYL